MDTNFDRLPFIPPVDGINDDFSGFAFDYSVHGIPPAPNNSDPNSTIGLQLQTNLFSNRLGGFSASPDPNGSNPLNLDPNSDFSVTFDYWGMASGPFPFGGGTPNSSTMLSTFGVLTEGTTSQSILSADGVFFGTVAESGSLADYRVYSAARTFSHQCSATQGAPCDPNEVDVIDLQATHHAGQRESFAQLYLDAIGLPDPNNLLMAPQSVIDAVELLFPSGDPNNPTMGGPLFPGSSGLQWHEMEIRKEGTIVDWFMNGFKLITLDTTDWFDPNTPASDPNTNGTIAYGGGNISFGFNDTNFGSPTTSIGQTLNYALIDNIEVNTLAAPDPNADFDGDGLVTGLDFAIWQRNIGLGGQTNNNNGDANGDGIVNEDDLVVWEAQFGGPPPLGAITSVPEPSTLISWITFSLFTLLGCRPCRQTAEKRSRMTFL